jgi:integrase
METEIDQLIASCRKKLSTILQILKETGMRIGEAHKLKWIDINLENKTINITPEKGSNPRILPISDKLIAMLNRYPKTGEHILPKRLNSIRSCFDYQRIRTAEKLQNQRIMKISFHTLRHWKGTMEYHKTKDIMHVKYVLGHKSITSTMIYINIEQAMFLADTDEWITKISHNIDEEAKIIEANFTLVRSINETTAIYKKRK